MAGLGELYEIAVERRMTHRATPQVLDFTNVVDHFQHASGNLGDPSIKPVTADGRQLSPKQIRARLRRKMKRSGTPTDLAEIDALYGHRKPIEEWDLEELAKGRPRAKNGTFQGARPTWIDARVHEEITKIFVEKIRNGMRDNTRIANDVIRTILENDEVDEKGRPIVPFGTKLDAAKFLLEHQVGKPTQRVEQDISVKLQGIMATVMANPSEVATGYVPAHFPGVTMALASGQDQDEDDHGGE